MDYSKLVKGRKRRKNGEEAERQRKQARIRKGVSITGINFYNCVYEYVCIC
jgi:hypothetical protein